MTHALRCIIALGALSALSALVASCAKVKETVCDAPPPVPECGQAASAPSANNEEPEADADASSGKLTGKLRARRLELERREAELARREAALQARDDKASTPPVKHSNQATAREIAAAQHEASVQRVSELVAEMKAKNAVNFLSALNDTQGAEILLRLEKSQAVAILAALPPQRAAHMTLALAQGGSHAGH